MTFLELAEMFIPILTQYSKIYWFIIFLFIKIVHKNCNDCGLAIIRLIILISRITLDFYWHFLNVCWKKLPELCQLVMYQQIWLFGGGILPIMYSILHFFLHNLPQYRIQPVVLVLKWFPWSLHFIQTTLFIIRSKMSILIRFTGPLQKPNLTKLTFYPQFKNFKNLTDWLLLVLLSSPSLNNIT